MLAVRPADILSAEKRHPGINNAGRYSGQSSVRLFGGVATAHTGVRAQPKSLFLSPGLVLPAGIQPRPIWPNKIFQRIQLKRKRDVAAIPEQRHFKNS